LVLFGLELLTNNQSLAGRQPRTLPKLLAAQKLGAKGAPRYRACCAGSRCRTDERRPGKSKFCCPAVSASIHPSPALSLNGVKVKDVKSIMPLKRERSAAVALSARQEEPSRTPVRQKEQLLNAQRSATSLFGSFIGRAIKGHGCRPGPAKLILVLHEELRQKQKVAGLRPARRLSF
jgi:hypothetical protein